MGIKKIYIICKKESETAKPKSQQKFCPKTLNTFKSTLRVPVARLGWGVVHCFSLVIGYIPASKNLSLCEV